MDKDRTANMLFQNEKLSECWKEHIEDLYNGVDIRTVSGYLENDLNVDNDQKVSPKQNLILLLKSMNDSRIPGIR